MKPCQEIFFFETVDKKVEGSELLENTVNHRDIGLVKSAVIISSGLESLNI